MLTLLDDVKNANGCLSTLYFVYADRSFALYTQELDGKPKGEESSRRDTTMISDKQCCDEDEFHCFSVTPFSSYVCF